MKPFKNEFEFTAMCDSVPPKYVILLLLGVFTGLRVSDLLRLQKKHIITPEFSIIEKKTKKKRCFVLPEHLHIRLLAYCEDNGLASDDFLIFSTRSNKYKPLSRIQAFRVLKKASLQNNIENIGTHSMRKTFAKKHYEKHQNIQSLQKELNHQYITTTLMYLFDVSSLTEVPSFTAPPPLPMPTPQETIPKNTLTLTIDLAPLKRLWAFIRKLWH